jgi:hypothetical protein
VGSDVVSTSVITASATQTTYYVYDSLEHLSGGSTPTPALYTNEMVTAVIYPDSSDSYNPTTHVISGGTNLVQYASDRQGRKGDISDFPLQVKPKFRSSQ